MNGPKPKTTTQTKPGDPKTPVVAEPFEYIVIVGTENYHKNAANKAMFMHAALRELKTYPTAPDARKVVMFFPTDYSSELRKAFKAACLTKGVKTADYKELNTKDELITYVNSREYRQIKQVDIFSHGAPGVFLFGLGTGLDANMNMGSAEVAQLKADRFSVTAVITSYACQTANSNTGKNKDERLKNSIAMALGTATQTTVKAYMRKTTYEDVLGTAEDRQDMYETEGSLRQLKNPIDAVETTDQEKANGRRLRASINRRDKLKKDLKITDEFDPGGALHPVRADTVPEDVPANLFVFEPARHK
jgi:Domain of unknown function (DUF4347)